jgi:hypothetical protein
MKLYNAKFCSSGYVFIITTILRSARKYLHINSSNAACRLKTCKKKYTCCAHPQVSRSLYAKFHLSRFLSFELEH